MEELNTSAIVRRRKKSSTGDTISPMAWLVWGIAMAFVIFQFCIQLSAGVMISDLKQTFALTAFSSGLLVASYYYIYVTIQTPAGMLVDRFGARKLLTVGASICMVGNLFFANAHGIVLAEIGRILMGGGSAVAFVACLSILKAWFPKKFFGTMVGVVETSALLSTMVLNVVLAQILPHVGWRNIVTAFALISALLAIACWFIIKDRPPNKRARKKNRLPFFAGLKKLLSMPHAWINGLYSGLIYSLVTVFVALWGIPFLQTAEHLSLPMATMLASTLYLGVAIGAPLIESFAKCFKKRRSLLVGCGASTLALLLVVIYVPNIPLAVMFVLITLMGFTSTSYVLCFETASNLVPSNVASTSIGFCNMLTMLMAPLLQALIGFALTHLGPQPSDGNYGVVNFHIALAILPIGFAIATILAFFIPERSELKYSR